MRPWTRRYCLYFGSHGYRVTDQSQSFSFVRFQSKLLEVETLQNTSASVGSLSLD